MKAIHNDSFTNMQIRISEHILKKGHKNPEYIINSLVADRKGIENERGIKWGFQSAIGQGCSSIVIDLDASTPKHLFRPSEIAKRISWRHIDFESGTIQECYVVYNGHAVCEEIKKLKL